VLNTTGSLELILDAGETFQDTNVLINPTIQCRLLPAKQTSPGRLRTSLNVDPTATSAGRSTS
jgi:hypothetical protein